MHMPPQSATAAHAGAGARALDQLRVLASDARLQLYTLTLAAFVLRMVQLAVPQLRWDEGWTVAHAQLPWGDVLRIAAAEWHPPLYYLLMKLWVLIGTGTLSVRYLSVLAATLCVPLAYHAGRLWDGRARTGLFAALLCAWMPLFVYYGQVARMYTLATLLVVVAALALLRLVRDGRGAPALALATFLAAFTQYYTVWPLAALYGYGLIARPTKARALIASGLGALALYVPWLAYAYPSLTARLGTGAERGVSPLAGTLGMLPVTWDGLLFYRDASWLAPAVLGLIVVAGLAFGLRRRADLVRLSLPFMAIAIALLGISYGAQASGWNAPHRHIMLAVGVGLLAAAWALERLAQRSLLLALAAFALLAAAYWPTSAGYVYAKNLEVVDPFDTGIDEAYLHAHARADELAFFNVLARAGWYANRARPGDPPWSYAMRWDPIIEPMDVVQARVAQALRAAPRVWFVMHEGAFGPNAPLVDWLDANLYPASAEWRADPPMTHTLYLSYVAPQAGWTEHEVAQPVGPARLLSARYTATAAPGGPLAVELLWSAPGPVPADYTVYVHWMDDAGALVTQHDGFPGAGRRPTSAWQPGELVVDRHGARLPEGWRGRLHLVVGWYNPVSGEPIGGGLEVGQAEIR